MASSAAPAQRGADRSKQRREKERETRLLRGKREGAKGRGDAEIPTTRDLRLHQPGTSKASLLGSTNRLNEQAQRTGSTNRLNEQAQRTGSTNRLNEQAQRTGSTNRTVPSLWSSTGSTVGSLITACVSAPGHTDESNFDSSSLVRSSPKCSTRSFTSAKADLAQYTRAPAAHEAPAAHRQVA
jgi:hypothetical protein